jgi:hypothetical protein
MVRRTHWEAQPLARKFKTPDSERTRGFAWPAWVFRAVVIDDPGPRILET